VGNAVTRARFGALALVAAVSAAPVLQPLSAQVFRGGAYTVYLPITVTDAKGRPITGLEPSEFKVFEDGIVQEISVFARDPQPIALSLVIDSSTSMDEKLSVAQQAAVGFATHLGKNDVAQVIDFNSDIQIRQSFTHDARLLEEAIGKIRAGGSTSLYKAIYIAVSELNSAQAARPEEIRRQAIVLLSDGEDNTSLQTYDDVAERVKQSSVIVYAIGLRDREASNSKTFSQANFALRTLTQITGGRAFFLDDYRQLPMIYQQIADELSTQYFVGYNTRNLKRDGQFRTIAVRVTRPETVVRTRTGYLPSRLP
jgi:Ca-activated chloride channel homolog